MGHQIVGRAAGFGTYKLRYGHRGVNQPVREIGTGRCFVTSQNHGYAVDLKSDGGGDWSAWFENLNDGTNEGLRSQSRPIRSVQFHPEGRPGPLDTEFLFDDFLKLTAELRGRGRDEPARRSLVLTPAPSRSARRESSTTCRRHSRCS
jgi:carbamoyl-phosphate synthase small subunit